MLVTDDVNVILVKFGYPVNVFASIIVTDDGNIRVVIFGYPINVALPISVTDDEMVKLVRNKLVTAVVFNPIAINCV